MKPGDFITDDIRYRARMAIANVDMRKLAGEEDGAYEEAFANAVLQAVVPMIVEMVQPRRNVEYLPKWATEVMYLSVEKLKESGFIALSGQLENVTNNFTPPQGGDDE